MNTIDLVANSNPELTPPELAVIENSLRNSSGELFEFARGEKILDGCERLDDLWIIISGAFSVTSGEAYLGEIEPGNILGEIGLLAPDHPHTMQVTAEKRSAALKLCRTKLLQLLEQPEQSAVWNRLLAVSLARKLEMTNNNHVAYSNSGAEKEALLKNFVSEFSLSHVRANLHGDANSFKRVKALVWFSDLAGFSTQIMRLDEDQAGSATRELLQLQAERLAGSGAQLDKFMGDGVMAYWVEDEEDPSSNSVEHAVSVAIDVSNEIPKVAKKYDLDLSIRIGLHIGTAIAGNFGCDDRIAHTLVGADVNLAARYEQVRSKDENHPLGPVRISPAVFDLLPVEGQNHFAPESIHEVKHGVLLPVYDGPI